MSQTRFVNFGDLADASAIKTILQGLTVPSVLSGGNFFVTGNNILNITPFTVVEPDGMLIQETETQTLTINITSSAANYTVVYYHQDENVLGGNPATLNLVNGIQTVANINAATPSGVVLGWIQYPGGSVPLNTNQFILVLPAKLSNGLTLYDQPAILAPITLTSLLVSATGQALTQSSAYNTVNFTSCTTWTNSGSTNGTEIRVIPLRVGDHPFSKLVSKIYAPTGTIVTLSLIDSDGTVLTPSNNSFRGDLTPQTRTSYISPTPGEMSPGDLIHLQFSVALIPGTTVQIYALWPTIHNLPY